MPHDLSSLIVPVGAEIGQLWMIAQGTYRVTAQRRRAYEQE